MVFVFFSGVIASSEIRSLSNIVNISGPSKDALLWHSHMTSNKPHGGGASQLARIPNGAPMTACCVDSSGDFCV